MGAFPHSEKMLTCFPPAWIENSSVQPLLWLYNILGRREYTTLTSVGKKERKKWGKIWQTKAGCLVPILFPKGKFFRTSVLWQEKVHITEHHVLTRMLIWLSPWTVTKSISFLTPHHKCFLLSILCSKLYMSLRLKLHENLPHSSISLLFWQWIQWLYGAFDPLKQLFKELSWYRATILNLLFVIPLPFVAVAS